MSQTAASVRRYLWATGAGAINTVLSLVLLRTGAGPHGNDIYYYALQTRALATTGELLFFDRSPVYRVLLWTNALIGDPLVSAQVLAALLGGVCAAGLTALALMPRAAEPQPARRSGIALRLTVVAAALWNPAFFMLQLEFTKNLFALACMLVGLAIVAGRPVHTINRLSQLLQLPFGLGMLVLAALSHRLVAAIVLAIALHWVARIVVPRLSKRRGAFVTVVVAAALAAAAGLAFAWSRYHDRFDAIRLGALFRRLRSIGEADLLPSDRLWYFGLSLLVPVGVPLVLLGHRQWRSAGGVFWLSAWACCVPVLSFDWDGLSFRLLLLAPLLLALGILWSDDFGPVPAVTQAARASKQAAASVEKASAPNRRRQIAAVALALVALASLGEGLARFATNKGPDYRAFAAVFADLPAAAAGRRVVAHRGLAGYLWYELGIWAENFAPTEQIERYDRLVYAFRPELLQRYLPEGADPGVLDRFVTRDYLLVPEPLWQAFSRDHRHLTLVQSELNPYQARPTTGFRINAATARALSPVSYPAPP